MLRIGTLRKLLPISLFFISLIVCGRDNFEEEVDKALLLLNENTEECSAFTQDLLNKSKESKNFYGLTKSNYILGYINQNSGNYGKAVLYYLEGIRFAKDASYENATRDLIYLLQNTGNIFKKFGNYELAKSYYSEAMEIASLAGDFQKYTYLLLLSSKVLREQGKLEEASSLLLTTFQNFPQIKKKTIADIYNQLGIIYTDQREEQLAIDSFQKLISYVANEPKLRLKYSGRGYHNIANLHFELENFNQAVVFYRRAIQFKSESKSEESLFRTYKDLTESYIHLSNYDSANYFLNKAESLIESAKNTPNYYEVYKFKSQISKAQGNLNTSIESQNLYTLNLENYLSEQREIEAADKKYNLDLITQRYFALVAQEKRNQQIQYYSTVGGSVLVSLILLIITFFQYRKYRLRKDLEASLKPYIKDAL